MNRNRIAAVLLGPESYWVLLHFVFRWLGARNVPPTEAGNARLNAAVWLVACAGVAAAFLVLWVPGQSRRVALGRVTLASGVGLNACVLRACDAIHYPEAGRDSGLVGLWMLSVMLGAAVWLVCLVAALLLPRLRRRPAG